MTENYIDFTIKLLQRLRDKINQVLDEIIKDLEKVEFYEAKVNKDELLAKAIKVLKYLKKLYEEEKNKAYEYNELAKRVSEVTNISPAEYLDFHTALLRLGAIERLERSTEKGYLYIITDKINNITGEDIIKSLDEYKQKENRNKNNKNKNRNKIKNKRGDSKA
jgi:hypothetical protein